MPDRVMFRVLHSAGDVPGKFAPGDWALSGSITKQGDEYTFSGVNPAEEFGTFSLTCTPPPPTDPPVIVEQKNGKEFELFENILEEYNCMTLVLLRLVATQRCG